jgi:hypothetical protein
MMMNQVAASITHTEYFINCFKNTILICYSLSQIFEHCHVFKDFVMYLYIMILSSILVARYENILKFPCS